MGIIFAILKNEKTKVKALGKTLNLLVLLVAMSKCLAERISKERRISIGEAEIILIDCIKDGIKTLI
ncbi:MAG: hypothetical protein K1W16_12720 [Lachnospiraceae bacterium]